MAQLQKWLDQHNSEIDYAYEFKQVSQIPLPLIQGALYLGPCFPKKEMERQLQAHKIDAVISVGFLHTPFYQENFPPNYPMPSSYTFEAYDDANFASQFREILPRIAEVIHNELLQGRNVYVHCKAGVSRSPMAVIWYFMHYHRMNALQAVKHVKLSRHCIYPQLAFLNLLEN